MTKIALIREWKKPADKRVAFTPQLAADIERLYKNTVVVAESSPERSYTHEEFLDKNIDIVDSVNDADILIGIKEIPVEKLIANKTYLFFSHTIKKQIYNRNLLREILKKNITLIDYEVLTWENGSRILGFGRFAGIVGAYNGFLTWGKKNKTFDLIPAYKLHDYEAMIKEAKKIKLSNIKIALCGDGRVAHGVMEIFEKLNIKQVTKKEYLNQNFDEAVFVQLRSEDYYARKDGTAWDKSDFYAFPEEYVGTFLPYTQVTDLMFNAIYWNEKIPRFFSLQEMKKDDFKIKVIADITCDVDGAIPCTKRSTTIENPVFGWHPYTEKETEPFLEETVDIMAVGNLPCELPRDASKEFATAFFRHVLPSLLSDDSQQIIERATITKNGKLTKRFEYLQDYVD